MKKNLEQLIYEETEIRLNKMENKEYVFPKKATKTDYIIITLMIVVCMILAVLCMIGVIV